MTVRRWRGWVLEGYPWDQNRKKRQRLKAHLRLKRLCLPMQHVSALLGSNPSLR